MENFERIQNYLLNKMSEEERLLFEKEIGTNEDLAQQLEIQRFEMQTIDQMEEDALREKAKALRSRIPTTSSEETVVRALKPRVSRGRQFTLIAIAASVLLLIGFFLFQQASFTTSDALAFGYEQGNPEYSAGAREGTSSETVFEKVYLDILQNRNSKKAAETIRYFSTFASSDSLANLQAKINLAHAYMLNDDFRKAVDMFATLEKSSRIDDRKKEEIAFFKTLAILKTNESNGIKLLNDIKSQNGRFAPLAKSILDEMDH